MEQDIGEMEGPRVVAEKRDVQHVRNPEERDIHGGGGDGGEECVTDGSEAETAEHERVGRNERGVIEGYESEPEGREVEEKRQKKSEKRGKESPAEKNEILGWVMEAGSHGAVPEKVNKWRWGVSCA